jgi:hypothetical protein
MPPARSSSPASSPPVHLYLPFRGTFAKDTCVAGSSTALVGGTATLIAMCCPAPKAHAHAGGFGPALAQPSAFAPGQPKAGQFQAFFFPSLIGMIGSGPPSRSTSPTSPAPRNPHAPQPSAALSASPPRGRSTPSSASPSPPPPRSFAARPPGPPPTSSRRSKTLSSSSSHGSPSALRPSRRTSRPTSSPRPTTSPTSPRKNLVPRRRPPSPASSGS